MEWLVSGARSQDPNLYHAPPAGGMFDLPLRAFLAGQLQPISAINLVLIEDWAGLLVSDGDGVYQKWVDARQTCLAHLIRAARELAARPQPELAACGAWARVELQRFIVLDRPTP